MGFILTSHDHTYIKCDFSWKERLQIAFGAALHLKLIASDPTGNPLVPMHLEFRVGK